MQLVLLAWLAVQVVALPPLGVSLILAAVMVPQIVLLPMAGRLTDRYPAQQVAKWGCLGLALAHAGLAVLASSMVLSWPILAGYALMVGASSALFLPSKDKAAVQSLPARLQRAISLSSAFQFLGLLVGALLAGLVSEVSVARLLGVQALLMALAASYWHISPSMPALKAHPVRPMLSLIRANKGLQHLLVLCALNGFLHMGFAVALFPELGLHQWQLNAGNMPPCRRLFIWGR